MASVQIFVFKDKWMLIVCASKFWFGSFLKAQFDSEKKRISIHEEIAFLFLRVAHNGFFLFGETVSSVNK